VESEAARQEAGSSRVHGFAALFSLRSAAGGRDESGDVNRFLYSYPCELSGWKVNLARMRGAFLTLSQVAKEVIRGPPVM
jgi:hypothetical protein